MKNSKIGFFALAVVFAAASAFAVKGQPKVFAKINGTCQEITSCTLQNIGQAACGAVVDGNLFYPTISCLPSQGVSTAYVRTAQ